MKYTVENTSKIGKRVRVFLNDVEMQHVVEADDEKGYVTCICMDKNNHIIHDGDDVQTETLYGVVRVEPWDAE